MLLMISSSVRVYNRELWLKFLTECNSVPIELVIYHEDMLNCTVRSAHNLISRYRPFPDLFPEVIPLSGRHGTVDFAQVHLQMLEYGANMRDAFKCIVITERTVPIRSPIEIYKRAMLSPKKCHIDVSYNVAFDRTPYGIPKGVRNRPFAAANNMAQGSFSVDFLKSALPTVVRHCERFGIKRVLGKRYKIINDELYSQWCKFTGANPCEFWLLNSFLIEEHLNGDGGRPVRVLTGHMEKSDPKERYTVAEIPEWRDDVKRTHVFRHLTNAQRVSTFDSRVSEYYRGLNFNRLTLRNTIEFLQKNKNKALFFRQVELPPTAGWKRDV